MAAMKELNNQVLGGGRHSYKTEAFRRLKEFEKFSGVDNKLEFERKYELD
ncbi:hypothetical protein [Latilactobacillus curvatus]